MIYTSYFSNVKRMLGTHNGKKMVFVSIAGRTPDWFSDGLIKKYKKLMPKYEWWKKWHDEYHYCPESRESLLFYVKHYTKTVLAELDANEVAAELNSIAGNENDVALLCYEDPTKFCHRRLVAHWFRINGIECEEWNDLKEQIK